MSEAKSLFFDSIKIIVSIISFILIIFLFSSEASEVKALVAGPAVYSNSPPPANYSVCPVVSTCTGPDVCWNSERMGVTNCGSACTGGSPWTKYIEKCLLDPQDPTGETCFPYYQRTEAVYSTADKCSDGSKNPPAEAYLKGGNCSGIIGGIYKTCCSNTTPSYIITDPKSGMGGAKSCTAVTPYSGAPFPPYDGVCPAGSIGKFCGFGGYPACGQEACGTLPNASPSPSPSPSPPPPGCNNTCRYSQAIDSNTCPSELAWVSGSGCSDDNCAGCTYDAVCSDVTCIAPGATPAPTSAPPASGGCGSCAGGCGGDPNKSHCYASDGSDIGCQPSYQCFTRTRNGTSTCTWDPTNCQAPASDMHCYECGYGTGIWGTCGKTTTISWEGLGNCANPGECPNSFGCSSNAGSQAYGPMWAYIQKTVDNCNYLNEPGGSGCGGHWGASDVDLGQCICGSDTSQIQMAFSPQAPSAKNNFNVDVSSYKPFHINQSSGGAGDNISKSIRPVYLQAVDSSGRQIDFGTPAQTTEETTGYNISCGNPGDYTGSTWTRYHYKWNNLRLNTAGDYTFYFYVESRGWTCNSTTKTVIDPPPTPNVRLADDTCATSTQPLTGQDVTISWPANTNPAITYVDISRDNNFSSYYNKAVPAGANSITAPDAGNSGNLLQPQIQNRTLPDDTPTGKEGYAINEPWFYGPGTYTVSGNGSCTGSGCTWDIRADVYANVNGSPTASSGYPKSYRNTTFSIAQNEMFTVVLQRVSGNTARFSNVSLTKILGSFTGAQGASGNLTFTPGNYFARLWNGYANSDSVMFNIPLCPCVGGPPPASGGIGACGSAITRPPMDPDLLTIGTCNGTWTHDSNSSLGDDWCKVHANPTRGRCYTCVPNTVGPWIQTTGDVHSNTRIRATGGP